MLEKHYKKIARPLSVIFACLSVITIIDFFIPREIYSSTIADLSADSAYHPHYSSRPTYTMQIENQTIRTNDIAYRFLYVGDTIEVHKTKILKKITRVKKKTLIENEIDIYAAPYTYFPLFPVLFLLPIIFAFTNDDSIPLMIARPFSLGMALVSLLMVIF